MTFHLFRLRSLGLGTGVGVLLAGVAATPALAVAARINTSGCFAPPLFQPFLSAGDSNWYMLAPGQTPGNFTGSGWTLTGRAAVVNVPLQSGRTGSVLDLPSGSTAVSPPVCVTADYPTARTMLRNVVGTEGVQFYVSYAGPKTWSKPENTGQIQGGGNSWTLPDPIDIQPGSKPGWQLVRFTFVPGGQTSDFQIYNFYVDPRMR
jgi:hypothetical protein